MRIRNTILALLIAAPLTLSLTGCEEPTEGYEQAMQDLEQGNYEYALQGYVSCIEEGTLTAMSQRGAGISSLRLGDYEGAIRYFSDCLSQDKLDRKIRQDVLYYRATAYMKSEDYDNAMADCQTLKEDFGEDSQTCFLTASVALAMDAYEEAASEFDLAYEKDAGYETAIRIYQQYIDRGMEADGTRYLEASLSTEPETAEDYCDRGRVYYYMEDYKSAAAELIEAANQGSKDANLLLGMVYLGQKDTSNARSMYQQYIDEGGSPGKGYDGLALCDLEDGNYAAALEDIEKGKPAASTEELQSLMFNEIVVYEKMLDFDTAREKAEEYCTLFPDDAAAAKELAFLRSREKTVVEEPVTETTTEAPAEESYDSYYDDGSYYDDSSYYDESYYDDGSYYDESYYDSYYDENYY